MDIVTLANPIHILTLQLENNVSQIMINVMQDKLPLGKELVEHAQNSQDQILQEMLAFKMHARIIKFSLIKVIVPIAHLTPRDSMNMSVEIHVMLIKL